MHARTLRMQYYTLSFQEARWLQQNNATSNQTADVMLYLPGADANLAWSSAAGDSLVLSVGRIPAMSQLEVTLVVSPKLSPGGGGGAGGQLRRRLLQADDPCWSGSLELLYSDPCDSSKDAVSLGVSIIRRCADVMSLL
jgi:hypothetical protein